MTTPFKRIILFARQRSGSEAINETVLELSDYLKDWGYEVYLEEESAGYVDVDLPSLDLENPDKRCDLAIVVGGDGSMLNAARSVVNADMPILGINRGRLGFLTDIKPKMLKQQIKTVLAGHYIEEQRFLLQADLHHQGTNCLIGTALNDVVLHPGNVAHMIEFTIYIGTQLVATHRADGIIAATPTGSTAYALSAGGPILHPSLNAIVLVPMFPHTLSTRPIVINADKAVRIVIHEDNESPPFVSCDSHERIPVAPGDEIIISKLPKAIRLIHPEDYNYYETLRSKLRWEATPQG